MPFGKRFEDLLAKFDNKSSSPSVPFSSKPSTSLSNPPSIPTSSKPPPAYFGSRDAPPLPQRLTRQAYWQPRFDPSVPITEDFRQETGDHGWGNNELQNYAASSENAFFTSDGKLVLRAIAASSHPDPKQRYTSARLNSKQLLGRPTGYLEARITAPVALGIWPAFWLLPEDPFKWPEDGEVDIMELWNGERWNHSCLHWGQHDGRDWDKHRVIRTQLGQIDTRPEGHVFGFAWDEGQSQSGGTCIWYIDGKPVMRATKPVGTRPWAGFRVLLNVAMGGSVCQGVVPRDGCYDLVVHEMGTFEEPPRGWNGYSEEFRLTQEGRPNS